MRGLAAACAASLLWVSACGPIRSKGAAVSAAEQAIGASHVTRSDAKAMTWQQWQERSGNRGGPVPGPSASTKVWAVALHGQFRKLPGVSAVVIIDATTGNMIMGTTGTGWDWPPYWDSL